MEDINMYRVMICLLISSFISVLQSAKDSLEKYCVYKTGTWSIFKQTPQLNYLINYAAVIPHRFHQSRLKSADLLRYSRAYIYLYIFLHKNKLSSGP